MSTEKLDLTPTAKPKNADVGAEFARLEQLTRDLNKARHPSIAVPDGVKVASDGEYSAPSGADGATTTLADPIFGSPIPKTQSVVQQAIAEPQAQPQPVAPPPPPPPQPQSIDLSRIFFTGRSGVGKTHLAGLLGAAEFCIQDPILRMLSEEFAELKGNYPYDFINLVILWGEGVITDKVPITATRILFSREAKRLWGSEFGTSGFWTRRLLDAALEHDGQSVVTTVTDEKQFTALKEAGLVHFHVMCSNPSLQQRQRRKGANDALANTLDNQVMKALSMQREGPKIRAIWCDSTAPPLSSRLYDIGGFLAEAKGAAPSTGSVAGE